MNTYYMYIISFLFISILGSLLHFTHGWFKKGLILHMFSATNESTWEHMKLLLLPTLLLIPFQYFHFRNIVLIDNFWGSILILLVIQMITIPLLYEPLRILFKKVHFIITILIFELAIIFGLVAQYYVVSNSIAIISERFSVLLILLIVLKFGYFTFKPPKIFIFRDPVTGKYGDRLK